MIPTERIEEDPAMFEIKHGERFMEKVDAGFRKFCERNGINWDAENGRGNVGRPKKQREQD